MAVVKVLKRGLIIDFSIVNNNRITDNSKRIAHSKGIRASLLSRIVRFFIPPLPSPLLPRRGEMGGKGKMHERGG
jgi:hypothetical protein